jgi:hypothetical protein
VGFWFRLLKSFENDARAEAEFWAKMTPDERVGVVEELRAEWWELNGMTAEGFRRTIEVL